jgi:xanthine phosphoribosyltransferase
MKELEDRIRKDGHVIMPDILKVDSFLNHQIDVALFEKMGAEFKKRFADKNITKIMTIESSGIGVAVIADRYFDYVPVVFVKKAHSKIMNEDAYHTKVHSFTKGNDYEAMISKNYLNEGDHVLIIDDFLANGAAASGMIELCKQAHAKVEGVGIVIEKGFQKGRSVLEAQGVQVESLAIIDHFEKDQVVFK